MKIIKRDKSIEDFDINKIFRVVQAAGLSEPQAKQLISDINKWIKDNFAVNIPSTMVRDKVFDELSVANKNIADLFKWYEENKYKK
jgi:transcriptional regulator NrdR family protein